MDNRIIGSFKVNMDVLNLYLALHKDKGKTDDTQYAGNVVGYYNKVLNDVIYSSSLEGLKSEITSPDEIYAAISNLEETLNLKKRIVALIKKNADFTKLNTSKMPTHNIVKEEYRNWIYECEEKLETLPLGEGYVGDKYISYPLRLLNNQKRKSFNIPESDKNYIENRVYNRECYCTSESVRNLIDDIYFNGASQDTRDCVRIAKAHIGVNDVICLNDIFNAYRDYVMAIAKRRHKEISRERNAKNTSLICGILGHILITATVLFALWMFRPSPFIFSHQLSENIIFGVWSNIWRTVVLALVIAGVMYLAIFCTYAEGNYFKYLVATPVFPRFLNTLVIIYLGFWAFGENGDDLIRYLSVSAEYADNYMLIIKVTSVGAAIGSISFETLDMHAYSNDDITLKERFESKNRGQVFFSGILAIIPTLLYIAFIFITACVHYVSVWVLGVIFMIGCLGFYAKTFDLDI